MDTPYLIASSAIDDTAICNDVSTVAQWHILRPMEDGKTPLAKVLIRRIDEAVGGNQAAYARLVGITPTHLNQMVKGKISLPGKEHRKALANDLGIRVIDFFVMAEELDPEDIPVEGAVREPFLPGDVRREVLAALEDVNPDTDLKRGMLRAIVGTLRELQKPEPFDS